MHDHGTQFRELCLEAVHPGLEAVHAGVEAVHAGFEGLETPVVDPRLDAREEREQGAGKDDRQHIHDFLQS